MSPGRPDAPDQPKQRGGLSAALKNMGAGALLLLARAMHRRYQASHALRDLDQALEGARLAAQRASAGNTQQAEALVTLGDWLLERFSLSGDTADLDEAAAALRRFVQTAPPNAPERAAGWMLLGVALGRRYDALGQPEDLDDAIEAFHAGLENAPNPSSNRTGTFNNLCKSLLDRYHLRGERADLEDAVAAGRAAVQAAGPGSPDLSSYLNNLANALHERYERTGDVADLEEAIRAHREALSLAGQAAKERATSASGLGIALTDRYLRFGQNDDLYDGLRLLHEATRTTAEGSPERLAALNNLAGALVRLYDQTGQGELLDEAIAAWQQSVQETDPRSPDFPVRLGDLAVGLFSRYERQGRLEDLDQAIGLCRQALSASTAPSPEHAGKLHNLGIFLAERYDVAGRIGDLDEAVQALRDAVRLTPPEAKDSPNALVSLANALDQRFERDRNPADLDEALGYYRQALKRTPPDASRYPSVLSNYAVGLGRLFEQTGRQEDIDEALRMIEEAITNTPAGSPALPGYLNDLGMARRSRYAGLGMADDLVAAEQAFEASCTQGLDLDPSVALRSAHNWGNWAFDRAAWQVAARAFDYGMTAIDYLFQAQLLRRGKETWLEAAQRLPARASYALAQCDRLEEAVVALEQGRARLLSHVLERDRADLDALASQRPDLNEAYVARSKRIADLESQEIRLQSTPAEVAEDMRAAQAALATAVDAIRRVPGYEGFLARPDFGDVAAAARPETPLVYVTSTSAGGVALVVEHSRQAPQSAQVTAIWLPQLIEGRLRQIVDDHLTAYDAWTKAPADEITRKAWQDTLDGTTRWLWDAAMSALAAHFAPPPAVASGESKASEEREIVLIATGQLTLLPLHAAWAGDPASPTGRRYAVDTLAITYAPNARALTAARQIAAETEADRLLAVDNPDGTLVFSNQEIEAVRSYFPSERANVLRGAAATRQAVLDHLPKFPIYHLSTHGWAGWEHPLESGLLLANGFHLTLADVLALRLAGARLAVLSACETGIPGTVLPDEVVGMPAGLVQAGVAGVVASLWAVNDLSTAMLMERFYRLWRKDGIAPARALRRAQIWLRDSTNQELTAYFEQEALQTLQVRMPAPVAAHLAFNRLRRDPAARDFAHPIWWAAFTMTGA